MDLLMGLLRLRQTRECGSTSVCVPKPPIPVKETACPELWRISNRAFPNFTCWHTRSIPPFQPRHTLLHTISLKLQDNRKEVNAKIRFTGHNLLIFSWWSLKCSPSLGDKGPTEGKLTRRTTIRESRTT